MFVEYGGELSQLALKELVVDDGVPVSLHTVQRILSGPDWSAVKVKTLPKNTDKHKENRVLFCGGHLNDSFGGDESDTLHIDIDEKHFYAFRENRVVYCPAELCHVFETVERDSKKQIPKVMFFGAVARPRPSRNFDGRILLKPIMKPKVMQRRSKYAAKGATVEEPTTMNKKLFLKMCKKDLLDSIRKKVKELPEVKKVVVQFDGAGSSFSL